MRAGAGPGKRKSRAVAGCVSFFCLDRHGVGGAGVGVGGLAVGGGMGFRVGETCWGATGMGLIRVAAAPKSGALGMGPDGVVPRAARAALASSMVVA